LFFSVRTVFFSHKKSANSIFQPTYNSSRTAPVSLKLSLSLHLISCHVDFSGYVAGELMEMETTINCRWDCPDRPAQNSSKREGPVNLGLLRCPCVRARAVLTAHVRPRSVLTLPRCVDHLIRPASRTAHGWFSLASPTWASLLEPSPTDRVSVEHFSKKKKSERWTNYNKGKTNRLLSPQLSS
jgi:hypothetical protein